MKNRLALCASFMLVISATSASAQEKGQIGLTMGYPTAAGVQWHATGRVAARATVTFSRFSTESTIAIPVFPLGGLIAPARTSSTSSAVSVGLSGLFYLSKADGVSTFVSPRYTYQHVSSDTVPYLAGLNDNDGGDASHAIGGAFGVQYAPNRRFSIFGEAGLEHQSRDVALADGFTSTNRTISTRAGVGVILYFRK